jgi:phosphohistidine phosphatase
MELFIVRHGEATRIGTPGVECDRDRRLSPLGIEKTQRASDALNKMGVRINAILCSPYPRALRTAEILCDRLDHPPQLRSCDALACDGDVDTVLGELRRVSELKSVAVCGHEPDLSRLTTRLLGRNGQPCLIFHTGSIASVKVDFNGDQPTGLLHWFLNSHQLDFIAAGH